MHTAKDMGHDCILLARKPRDLSRTLAMEPGKVAPRGMRYVGPMSREGMRDLEYIQNWGYHKLKAACSESIKFNPDVDFTERRVEDYLAQW